MKKYTSPPLPFVGNKRYWRKTLLETLEHHAESIGNGELRGWTIVDIFGGSGFVSHVVKERFPLACVVYNDFEDFVGERLEKIEQTERIRRELWDFLEKNGRRDDEKITDLKDEIFTILEKYPDYDKKTIASWLSFYFSRSNEWKKRGFYHGVRKNPLNADGYLEWVERRVGVDWKTIFEEYKNREKTLFIFDPPYLNTDNGTYKIHESFSLSDFLDITLAVFSAKNWVFFSSSKSSTEEFWEFFQKLTGKKLSYQKKQRNMLKLEAVYATEKMLFSFSDDDSRTREAPSR